MDNIFNILKQDHLQSRKNKDNIKSNLLGTLIGDCTKTTKEPSDVECIQIIKKFIKNAEETSNLLDNSLMGIRFKTKYELEIKILESYLPKQLTEEKIKSIITCDIIHKTRLANDPITIGIIQKHFKENYQGQYDGALVSKIAKELLSR